MSRIDLTRLPRLPFSGRSDPIEHTTFSKGHGGIILFPVFHPGHAPCITRPEVEELNSVTATAAEGELSEMESFTFDGMMRSMHQSSLKHIIGKSNSKVIITDPSTLAYLFRTVQRGKDQAYKHYTHNLKSPILVQAVGHVLFMKVPFPSSDRPHAARLREQKFKLHFKKPECTKPSSSFRQDDGMGVIDELPCDETLPMPDPAYPLGKNLIKLHYNAGNGFSLFRGVILEEDCPSGITPEMYFSGAVQQFSYGSLRDKDKSFETEKGSEGNIKAFDEMYGEDISLTMSAIDKIWSLAVKSAKEKRLGKMRIESRKNGSNWFVFDTTRDDDADFRHNNVSKMGPYLISLEVYEWLEKQLKLPERETVFARSSSSPTGLS
ncbi:hypothetical protein QBC38DRAFT_444856 [Podospora fimiseda]|uniref:Uncharacterized protein n=1 Tax=Podospora fimiseda TaxID=252190 RepID=A0AAN7BML5_9PEZI|nr:hypothetical protein QBC38DRAFT_444856 [Podospora fimiseda]